MPGSTSTFGITYPCENDIIGPAAFSGHATSTEAALASVWAKANAALQPPAVAVNNPAGQTVSVGVTTVIAFSTTLHDRGGFWNAGAPTLLTIPAPGSYFVASTTTGNITGSTITSVRYAILRNGAEYAFWEGQNTATFVPPNGLNVHALIPNMSAGETISINVLYTGTQPTLNFFGRLTVTKLALP